jgi:hypothetical protein
MDDRVGVIERKNTIRAKSRPPTRCLLGDRHKVKPRHTNADMIHARTEALLAEMHTAARQHGRHE